MPKIGMSSAGREDEVVIIDIQIDRFYFFGIDINGLHLRKDHFHVPAFAQDCTHGGGSLGGWECGCGHLLGKRLEDMLFWAAAHVEVSILTCRLFGCLEPPKPRTDN